MKLVWFIFAIWKSLCIVLLRITKCIFDSKKLLSDFWNYKSNKCKLMDIRSSYIKLYNDSLRHDNSIQSILIFKSHKTFMTRKFSHTQLFFNMHSTIRKLNCSRHHEISRINLFILYYLPYWLFNEFSIQIIWKWFFLLLPQIIQFSIDFFVGKRRLLISVLNIFHLNKTIFKRKFRKQPPH